MLEHFGLKHEELQKNNGIHITEDKYLEIKITSYNALDKLITLLNFGKTNTLYETTMFYRGVSSKDFSLLCSLERNNLIEYESALINDFYNLSPQSFVDCKNHFDMVAKMQHFGLPTRLLDFTTNPYIAVWFACQTTPNSNDNTPSNDGAIYIFYDAFFNYQKAIELIFRKVCKSDPFRLYSEFYSMYTPEEREYYINTISINDYIFIRPAYISQRQINQQSIFMVCLNQLIVRNFSNTSDSPYTDIINIKDIKSPTNTLNTYIDYSSNRHIIMQDEFLHISLEEKKKSALKIIIPENIKLEILHELEIRGITEDFIYPELENIARRVTFEKKKFKDSFDKWCGIE